MKKISILILIIATGLIANAQQLPQFTQYMINDYVFNPAIAGIESNYQMKSNIRNQWVGVNDAPRTTVLSIYGKHRDIPGTGHITGPIVAVCAVLFIGLIFSWIMYSCWREGEVKRMVQDHFYDWKQKGIKVEYHPPYNDDTTNTPGYISLTLPPNVPAVSESVPTQNYYSFENSNNVQSICK